MNKHLLTSILFIFVHFIFLHGQGFRNLDFQQLCDTSKTGLCYWDLSWGGKGTVRPGMMDGKNSLLIEGKALNSVGFTEQAVSFSFSQTRIVTVSARIKTDSVEGKGAGLNIGLYDSAGQLISNKDMGGFYSLDWIRGSRDWKVYSISIVCPLTTKKIRIGMILYGK